MPQHETKSEKLKSDFEKMKNAYGINIYEKIFELRKFEIENFWKRTLFFWGTITIIYAGYFSASLGYFQIIVPLIGVLFNVIFSLSTRGSKYWQEHWESIAIVYENELNFKLFSTGTSNLIDKHNKSILTKPYRFSVSKLTMLLGDLSVLTWIILWIKELFDLFSKNILRFEFSICDSSMHWLTVGIIAIHLTLISYFMLFIMNGNVYHKFKGEK